MHGIAPALWQQFVGEYQAAADRLAAPYKEVRLIGEEISTTTDAAGKATKYVRNFELQRSGPFRAFRRKHPDLEQVYLARPDASWLASRRPPDAWEIRDHPTLTAEQAYRSVGSEIDSMEPFSRASAPLSALADLMTTVIDPLSVERGAIRAIDGARRAAHPDPARGSTARQ